MPKEKTKTQYKCGKCDYKFKYEVSRHNMESCTCKDSAVDVEENYSRHLGYVEEIPKSPHSINNPKI